MQHSKITASALAMVLAVSCASIAHAQTNSSPATVSAEDTKLQQMAAEAAESTAAMRPAAPTARQSVNAKSVSAATTAAGGKAVPATAEQVSVLTAKIGPDGEVIIGHADVSKEHSHD